MRVLKITKMFEPISSLKKQDQVFDAVFTFIHTTAKRTLQATETLQIVPKFKSISTQFASQTDPFRRIILLSVPPIKDHYEMQVVH